MHEQAIGGGAQEVLARVLQVGAGRPDAEAEHGDDDGYDGRDRDRDDSDPPSTGQREAVRTHG